MNDSTRTNLHTPSREMLSQRLRETEPANVLAHRLRLLADEIQSAHRYGVPVPTTLTVDSYDVGGVTFSATPAEYNAWVDYCVGVEVRDYDHDEKHWRTASADVNGLNVRFAMSQPQAVSA